jgi:photosystem II stability/assembly factor-like uncharacterized protein
VIASIVQDPADPQHVFLLFKHPSTQEISVPLYDLLRESHDGGQTWEHVTELNIESYGIADAAITESAYYFTNPWNDFILKLEDSSYELIAMPRVEELGEMTFGLARLIFDIDDPDIVYGMTDPIWALGLVKSEDHMETWHKMDGDIIASSPTIVLPHPTDISTVFTSGNIIQESYCTRDGGQTWEPFTPVAAGDEIRIDPHNADHILLVDEMTNIYESYDGGITFYQTALDFSSAKILDFEIPRDDPSKIFVSNAGVGLSEYAGWTEWQYLTNSPDYSYAIEIDPEDSNILYAAYSPKVFEDYSSVWRYSGYQEEHSRWSEILRVENSAGITALKIDPSNPDKIYAGVIGERGAIYASNDRGDSWSMLNEHFTMCTVWGQSQLIVDPDNPSLAYAATWLGGTWRTTDAGETWELLEEAPISSTALSLNLRNTDAIYLADRSSPAVWKSEDGGQTWEQVADFAADGALLVMRVLSDGDAVFASTFHPSLGGGQLYKSTNGGSSWSDITATLPRGILDVAVDPTDPDTVYVTTNVYGVYKSTDGGTSWSHLGNHPYVGVYDIEVDPVDPTILYSAARGGSLPAWFTQISGDFPDGITFEDDAGVYKSTDSGLTWDKVLVTSVSCRAIRVHPDNHNILFAVDLVDGLQMSTDGGDSWASLNSGLDTRVLTSCAVASDKIYVGTQGCGVYSGDFDIGTAEVIWQPDRSNRPVPEVHNLRIEVDPANSNNIYVASYPGGLYASTDGGATFRDRNAITPSVVVDYPLQEGYYALAINPKDPSNMWIGTWGKGIYKSYNSMILNVPMGLFGKHIRQIAISPSDPNMVYVATKEGVFVTRDEGATWEEMNDGLGTLDTLTLKIADDIEWPPFEDDFEDGDADGWQLEDSWSVVQESGNYVLHGIGHKWANAGLQEWRDYTFQSRVRLLEGAVHINFRMCDEGRYFLGFHGDGLGLHKQFDQWRQFTDLAGSGDSHSLDQWYELKVELEQGNIKVYVDDELMIDYTDPEPLLNGSIAYETLEDARVHIDEVRVEIEPSDSLIYAGTAGYGLYRLDTVSQEWQSLGRSLGSGFWSPWERRMYQFSSLLFDPDIPGRVYYGHFPSGFFISEDNGHTWRESSLGLGNDGMFSLAMHPQDHDILFAGTYNGVVKSMDRGRTWEMKSTGMPSEQWPYTVAIDSSDPSIMYTSTKNGQNKGFCHRNQFCGVVMKSIDGAESWFQIMDGLPDRTEFYTLLIYPLNHDALFLSTSNGVYWSKNAGDSWEAINDGLPSIGNEVRDNVAENLALSADDRYLILGLAGHGVWKADLSGVDFTA